MILGFQFSLKAFFCIYSTFISKNFSASTKSQTLSYSDLLTPRIFSYLKTFNVFPSSKLFETKPFPLIGLLQKLPVITSDWTQTQQSATVEARWKSLDNGGSGFIEYKRFIATTQVIQAETVWLIYMWVSQTTNITVANAWTYIHFSRWLHVCQRTTD